MVNIGPVCLYNREWNNHIKEKETILKFILTIVIKIWVP